MEVPLKALRTVGIVVLFLVVVFVVLAFVAPKEFHVERSIIIEAPEELVFDHVRYWRNWTAWSPRAEQDSTIAVTIIGMDGEKGSQCK